MTRDLALSVMRMPDIRWPKKQKTNFNSDLHMQSHLLTNIKQLVNIRTDSRPLYGKEMQNFPVWKMPGC